MAMFDARLQHDLAELENVQFRLMNDEAPVRAFLPFSGARRRIQEVRTWCSTVRRGDHRCKLADLVHDLGCGGGLWRQLADLGRGGERLDLGCRAEPGTRA